MSIVHALRKGVTNLPGWKTKKKIVVIESDDWGTISIPSKEIRDELFSKGLFPKPNAFRKYDSLESREDLNELFNVLSAFKDIHGNPPCVTACAIMANPDFAKIRESDFTRYFYEPFHESYKRYPAHRDMLDTWKNGMQQKLFYPQLHGREHVNPVEWLKALQSGNTDERLLFERQCLVELGKSPVSKRHKGYMAAFDYETEEELAGFRDVIKEGQAIFTTVFGFPSKSFVAPTGIRSDKVDAYLVENGIVYHQLAQQFLPLKEAKKVFRNRVFGSRNQLGQIYWRRNGIFEPSREVKFDWIDSVMKDMESAFSWGKPFVISSHRVNFIGGIEKQNREQGLKALGTLLKKMLQRFPDIEFMSSEQLGDEIKSNPNYFLGLRFDNYYYDQKA